MRIVKFILDIKIAKERQTKRVREVVRWRYKHYFSIGLVHETFCFQILRIFTDENFPQQDNETVSLRD